MQGAAKTIATKRELGEKIAAIEGMSLSVEIATLFQTFDDQNKSASERIEALLEYLRALKGPDELFRRQ
jgi:hypothetical protein